MSARIHKHSVEEAHEMIRRGEISGFRTGRWMTAKHTALLTTPRRTGFGWKTRAVKQGQTILAETFAKTIFGVRIGGTEFTGSKRDFKPGQEVVLELFPPHRERRRR